MSENQGARLKIGPMVCTPPEGYYNNTLQLRLNNLEVSFKKTVQKVLQLDLE